MNLFKKTRRKYNLFENKEKKSKGIVMVWFLFALVIVLTVYVTIQTATSGARLATLEFERSEIEKENQILSSKLVRSTSLVKIEDKSEELGFSEPHKVVYIKAREPVAELPEGAIQR